MLASLPAPPRLPAFLPARPLRSACMLTPQCYSRVYTPPLPAIPYLQEWEHMQLLESYLRRHGVQLAVLKKSDNPEEKNQAISRWVGVSMHCLVVLSACWPSSPTQFYIASGAAQCMHAMPRHASHAPFPDTPLPPLPCCLRGHCFSLPLLLLLLQLPAQRGERGPCECAADGLQWPGWPGPQVRGAGPPSVMGPGAGAQAAACAWQIAAA